MVTNATYNNGLNIFSKGKEKWHICKQGCSTFHFVGDYNQSKLSHKLQTRKENVEKMKLEFRKVEGKG